MAESMAMTPDERAYRRELDKEENSTVQPVPPEVYERFRPIFEDYEELGGLPLKMLREKLAETNITEDIPRDRVDLLLRNADMNRDGRMSYEEFIRLMTSGENRLITKRQLTRFQRMVRASVGTVVPRKGRKEEEIESFVEAYTCCPPPIFIPVVSVAELIVFIVYAIELKKAGTPVTATTGVAVYSPLIYNPYRRYEAWRYLTYMFIHNGYFHIVFNMIFQLILGIPLEMVHKFWRVGIVYILGVIAGSLAHSVTDSSAFLAGASGGCYAILGAQFANIIMNWEEMQEGWCEGPIKFISSGVVRLVVLTLLGGMDTGVAIYERYQSGASQVGFAAHFGGFLAGVLVGIPTLRNLDKKNWEKIVFWVALIVYLLFMASAILFNTFHTGYPPFNMSPCCSMKNTEYPRSD